MCVPWAGGPGGADGGPCQDDADCKEGAACITFVGSGGKCLAPCATAADCPSGNWKCTGTVTMPHGYSFKSCWPYN